MTQTACPDSTSSPVITTLPDLSRVPLGVLPAIVGRVLPDKPAEAVPASSFSSAV